MKTLVESVAGADVVWVLPELQETLFAGQHMRSPQGLRTRCCRTSSPARSRLAEATPTAPSCSSRPGRGCERVRGRARAAARRGGHDRRGTPSSRARDRDDDETLGERSSSPSSSCPGSRRRKPAPAPARDGCRGRRAGRRALRGADVLATLAAGVGPAARAARSRGPAPARGGAGVLRAPRARATRPSTGRRADRDDQGRRHGSHAPSRGLPLRRADRHGQDRDREVARSSSSSPTGSSAST